MINVNDIDKIVINKNRGWRGLAELQCLDIHNDTILTSVFSFSQAMWEDMLRGMVVIQDPDHYHILRFKTDSDRLPKPYQQRSVLIKNFLADVTEVNTYDKESWLHDTSGASYNAIYHFKMNTNNHTTSDWNCIGIRVTPMI